ncbi:MAG: hypothetical protein ACRDSF_25720 [Pseudonocardiaceae bacterium]
MTGKHPYATEADARDALLATRVAAALRDNTRRRERRCYACPDCGHWHLTSSPDRVGRPPYAKRRGTDRDTDTAALEVIPRRG